MRKRPVKVPSKVLRAEGAVSFSKSPFSLDTTLESCQVQHRRFNKKWFVGNHPPNPILIHHRVDASLADGYIYSLHGTAKLNGIDPQAWLTETLSKISDHTINVIAEQLPMAKV